MKKMLIGFCRKAVVFLRSRRIYVGRDPRFVAGPALILFPLLPATLCCGLAGILILRRKVEPNRPGRDLSLLFGEAAGNDLAALLEGRIAASEYLGGKSSLEEMERGLLCLKGEEAFRRIFFAGGEARRLKDLSARMSAFLSAEETLLDQKAGSFSTTDLEAVNRGLVLIRDLLWGLEHDILDNVQRIIDLAGADGVADVDPEALPKYRKLNSLLNCLDRLEVRGRDSAGIEISFVPADAGAAAKLLAGLQADGLEAELHRRMGAGDLVNGSLTCPSGVTPGGNGAGGRSITFTYKTASIIGELGRNVRELRTGIAQDRLFQAFARLPVAFETAFAHTRWASVGSITEENCHPLSNFTLPAAASSAAAQEKHYPAYGTGPWTIHVVLNGDIDNYQTLREAIEGGEDADRAGGDDGYEDHPPPDREASPRAVTTWPNRSGAPSATSKDPTPSRWRATSSPERSSWPCKGSGQSIYVGIAPDRYLFSSELYGLVEETPFFMKMDGEKPSRPDRPETTGQIFILDQDAPGGVEGIRGFFYDGTPLPLGEEGRPEGGDHDAGYRPGRLPPLLPQGDHRIGPLRPEDPARQVPHRAGSGGGKGRLQSRRGHRSRKDQGGPDRRGDPADRRHRPRNGGRRRKRRGRRDGDAISREAGSAWRPRSPPS